MLAAICICYIVAYLKCGLIIIYPASLPGITRLPDKRSTIGLAERFVSWLFVSAPLHRIDGNILMPVGWWSSLYPCTLSICPCGTGRHAGYAFLKYIMLCLTLSFFSPSLIHLAKCRTSPTTPLMAVTHAWVRRTLTNTPSIMAMRPD